MPKWAKNRRNSVSFFSHACSYSHSHLSLSPEIASGRARNRLTAVPVAAPLRSSFFFHFSTRLSSLFSNPLSVFTDSHWNLLDSPEKKQKNLGFEFDGEGNAWEQKGKDGGQACNHLFESGNTFLFFLCYECLVCMGFKQFLKGLGQENDDNIRTFRFC